MLKERENEIPSKRSEEKALEGKIDRFLSDSHKIPFSCSVTNRLPSRGTFFQTRQAKQGKTREECHDDVKEDVSSSKSGWKKSMMKHAWHSLLRYLFVYTHLSALQMRIHLLVILSLQFSLKTVSQCDECCFSIMMMTINVIILNMICPSFPCLLFMSHAFISSRVFTPISSSSHSCLQFQSFLLLIY